MIQTHSPTYTSTGALSSTQPYPPPQGGPPPPSGGPEQQATVPPANVVDAVSGYEGVTFQGGKKMGDAMSISIN